ncbi:hypothetical protein N8I77_009701 [Diaporthe amygdali]|uniref:H/ACA ribonucleoprotein complex subunit NOP10 n=1 Tax=Phomopsis amygdali TaxID=1214568 RepID=A0AAD9W0R4_PHOAM|nr:hypothetical protein N8I77_009701 [Diaporthe amygdali]
MATGPKFCPERPDCKPHISPYACIDREWNRSVELRLFGDLSIGVLEFPDFDEICSKRSGRLSKIGLVILNEPPDGPSSAIHDGIEDDLFQLFDIMKDWTHVDREQQGLIELELRLSFIELKSAQYPCSFDKLPEVHVIGSIYEVCKYDVVRLHPSSSLSLYRKLPNIHRASLTLPLEPSRHFSMGDIGSKYQSNLLCNATVHPTTPPTILLTPSGAISSLSIQNPLVTHLDLISSSDFGMRWPSPTPRLPITKYLTASSLPWNHRLVSLKLQYVVNVPKFLREASNIEWPTMKTIDLVSIMTAIDSNNNEGQIMAHATYRNIIKALITALPGMPKATTFRISMEFDATYGRAFKVGMSLGDIAIHKKPAKIPPRFADWRCREEVFEVLPCCGTFVPDFYTGTLKIAGMAIPGDLATQLQDAFSRYPELPKELRLHIIGEAVKPYTYKNTNWDPTTDTRLARFASIDFDWNQIIEQKLFQTIVCQAEDIAEFGEVCGKRYRHLKEIHLRMHLLDPSLTMLSRQELFVRGLEQLFNTMKDWSHADRKHQDLIQLSVFINTDFRDSFSSPPCNFSNFPYVQIIGGMSESPNGWSCYSLHHTAMHSLYKKLPNLHHASLALPFRYSLQKTIEDVSSAIRLLHTTKPGLTELEIIASGWFAYPERLMGRRNWITVSKCLSPLVSRWSDNLVSLTLDRSIDVPQFLLVASNAMWPNIKELNLSGPLDYSEDDADRTKADILEGLIASLSSMPRMETIRILLEGPYPKLEVRCSLKIDLGIRWISKEDFGVPRWRRGAVVDAMDTTPCVDSLLPVSTSRIAQAVDINLQGHLVTELQDTVWLHRSLDLERTKKHHHQRHNSTISRTRDTSLPPPPNQTQPSPQFLKNLSKMHLMCNVDPASGKRTYTLKKVLEGKVTKSAHPARFSPDDKWSKHRNLLRKRFGRLPQGI